MEAKNGELHVRWGATTDVGCTRPVNQDAILAAPPLFIVADGMGGHAAGDVASRITIDAFRGLLDQSAIVLKDLVAAARTANDRILEDVDSHPDRSGMGTTVTGFSLAIGRLGTYAAVVNVGDSRTYLRREGVLRALTSDHSVVQEMLDAGEIEPHEAFDHPYRHVVTRVLGTQAEVEVDTSAILLKPGDRFLVCSDGLTSTVRGDDVEQAMATDDSAEQVANLLLSLALAAGAPDNVSIIVVDVLAMPAPLEPDDVDTIPGARISA